MRITDLYTGNVSFIQRFHCTRHSRPDPNVSFIQRSHCTTRDSRPDPNVSFIQRFHCTSDSRPDPNVSFIQRFQCTTRASRPDPNVSFIQRFHCTTRDSRLDPNVSFIQRFHCLYSQDEQPSYSNQLQTIMQTMETTLSSTKVRIGQLLQNLRMCRPQSLHGHKGVRILHGLKDEKGHSPRKRTRSTGAL